MPSPPSPPKRAQPAAEPDLQPAAVRWARLDALFAAAEPLSAVDRAALLDTSFGADPDPCLRAELEALLAEAQDPLEERLREAISRQIGQLQPEIEPQRLGPYLLRRELGRGGMATVYLAERDDREFDRLVAIKVLRRGFDDPDFVRRLRRERQILANLDHPHIARLLDGGSTAEGRPYVVMEHIDGEPIDLYCRRHDLALPAKLELFRQICDAVHYAHRNLVLHRDIKPSNILVDAGGQPKLLDFGIAKLLVDDDTEKAGSQPEPTRTETRLLTPSWASPEQVRGAALSTASDVYSLGLLLYLLVTGRRAYDVDPRHPAELERIVCELEPPSPGRGDDLDPIVETALRKEPERRYTSAEQLGDDVRRYLENLPVSARKDTLTYRAGKFLRRHRWAVATSFLVACSLLAAAVLTHQQKLAARAQQRRAEQVAAFLTEVFETSDPGQARGRSVSAREVLDQGVRRIRGRLHEDPELKADLLGTLGRTYQKLGLYAEAADLLNEAFALHGGPAAKTPAVVAARRDLAALLFDQGQLDAADTLVREVIHLQRAAGESQRLGPSLLLAAEIGLLRGQTADAEKNGNEALNLYEKTTGPDSPETAAVRNTLGEIHFGAGHVELARAAFNRVLQSRGALGEDHPELITASNNLAAVESREGNATTARQLLREVVAARQRVFGENHPNLSTALNNLAVVEASLGNTTEAFDLLEKALSLDRLSFPGPHPAIVEKLHNLGTFYLRHGGSRQRAEELLAEALALAKETVGEKSPQVALTLRSLGELYAADQPQRAEAAYRQAAAIERRGNPPKNTALAASLLGLGKMLLRRGALPEAEQTLREAFAQAGQKGVSPRLLAEVKVYLGFTLDQAGHGPEGRPLLESGHRELERLLGANDPKTRQAATFLARDST